MTIHLSSMETIPWAPTLRNFFRKQASTPFSFLSQPGPYISLMFIFLESVGSHFRFKEENEEPSADAEEDSAYTLNCLELTENILCTPLHERLSISPSHFEVRYNLKIHQ